MSRYAGFARNIALLASGQGLGNSMMSILIAVSGLVGYALADDKGLATLPVSLTVAGTALATVPASFLMARIGRRFGFMFGATLGMCGALVAAWGIHTGSFWVYCAGCLCLGTNAAFNQYFRFAAAECAEPDRRPRAISLVMAGGIVAGFAGPEIAKHTRDLMVPFVFQGTLIAVFGLCAVNFLLAAFLKLPERTAEEAGGPQRPLATIMRQPVFLAAVASGMMGYGAMSLLMTATPLAMVACGHVFDDAATVIQWHVVAMFGPSFFTGSLIVRFGVLRIIGTGIALGLVCVAVALSGLSVAHFWFTLVLLGLAWNFMFIGGTALLTESYTPAERAKVQATNEFIVFGTVATASLSSGQLLDQFGWTAVGTAALPLYAIAAMAVLWLSLSGRHRPQRA
ncbi:MFS transporter [Oceanibacterium hippocampi]|uniref:Major Facilitator Superfamily protein n=1 Tax=Oceanibacterium hippocampi TaxID=745714 RepID=A0A1Y5SNU8_9PROT|nr:MFS transporter [Oceanibacterium hippocampi]SLN45000.1 Major Facilitator Superfamily protein [Oceanibacterium hippocampi]